MDEDIPDGFVMLERLGNGSFGRVELVKRESDDRLFALKVLNKGPGADSAEVEIKALQMVNSPFVADIYDIYRHDGNVSFLIDPALGGSLRQKIQVHREQNIKFEMNEIVNIITQILIGLKAIHEAGIVHRDLTPANVLFVEQNPAGFGHIQIIDFGVSGIASNGPLSGTFGTPSYMSPEVSRGEEHDSKADMYSLGVILYEMCELELPKAPGRQTLKNYPELSEMVSWLLSRTPAKRPSCDKCLQMKNLWVVASKLNTQERIILTSKDYQAIEYDFDSLDMSINFDDRPPIDDDDEEMSNTWGKTEIERIRNEEQRSRMIIRQQERIAREKSRTILNQLRQHNTMFQQRMKNAKSSINKQIHRNRQNMQRPVEMTDEEQMAEDVERMRMALEKKFTVVKLTRAYRQMEADPLLAPGELGLTPIEYTAISTLIKRDKEVYG